MKYIIGFFFLFSNFIISAQSLINMPTQRNAEFIAYSDSLAHTNFYPNNYSFSADSFKKKQLIISPFINLSQSFDLKTNNFAYDYLLGVEVTMEFFNKLRLNIIPYYSFFKPESFLSDFVDTLSVIPNIGSTLNNKNAYGGFIGSLIYSPQDYIFFELGNGKTFFGDGYRSLLLSDNTSPYPYFKTTVDVGNIKYVYMLAKQRDFDFRYSDNFTDLYPKYTFTHYLSFNFLKRLNFSMFETVVTSPYDSLGARRGIELNYLNPVVFLRSVEMQQGSPDNVLVGFSGHLKIFKSGMLYGQVFIDEFILSHIKSPVEYWDEKYGLQAGMKFYNTFGIKRFYSQFEFNAVRPYTYSHLNPIRAYTNNLQSLAHPMGANFVEGLAVVSYSFSDFYTQLKLVYSHFGDNDSQNYGKNPILSYETRVAFEGIEWFNGVSSNLKFAQLTFGYQKWSLLLKFDIIYRHLQTQSNISENFLFQLSVGKPLFNRYFGAKN
ncbi:MAG: hypothetical protein U9Q83_05340 [Bacteroidota bacterium]|nr:hypothetical protein [Bacteroidota bacterium]